MSDFEFTARVHTQEVINALSYLSYEDLLEFVKDLDDTVGDWDFTEMVGEYFAEQMLHLQEMRTPEHKHEYVGDTDDCVGYKGCPVTYQEYRYRMSQGI